MDQNSSSETNFLSMAVYYFARIGAMGMSLSSKNNNNRLIRLPHISQVGPLKNEIIHLKRVSSPDQRPLSQ